MYFVFYPFRYLLLRNEDGCLIFWRDVLPLAIISALLVAPFHLIESANFFAKDGFVDKAGSFTSSLTGFYIAGLLAVATFTASNSALDKPISVGKVFYGKGEERSDPLSRRDYVCLMFGYLSAISLLFSLISSVVAGISQAVSQGILGSKALFFGHAIDFHCIVSLFSKVMLIALIVHLVITTGYGLYYLTSKIYEKEAVLDKKPNSNEPRVRDIGP